MPRPIVVETNLSTCTYIVSMHMHEKYIYKYMYIHVHMYTCTHVCTVHGTCKWIVQGHTCMYSVYCTCKTEKRKLHVHIHVHVYK